MGVDQLEVRRQVGRPGVVAVGPIADHDLAAPVLQRVLQVAVGAEAVVEHQSGHALACDVVRQRAQHVRQLGILGLGKVFVAALVRSKVEIVALAGKIVDIFFHQLRDKGDRLVVVHAEGLGGDTLAVCVAGEDIHRHAQRLHGRDQRVGVARNVNHGDNPDALAGGIGIDDVHVRLCQLVGAKVLIALVARLDGTLHRVAVIGDTAGRHRQVIGQKAQAVVAEGQLDVRVVTGLGIVDDCLQIVHGEIFSAAVDVDNPQKLVLGAGFLRRIPGAAGDNPTPAVA